MPEKEVGTELDWEGGRADGALFTHSQLALGVIQSTGFHLPGEVSTSVLSATPTIQVLGWGSISRL